MTHLLYIKTMFYMVNSFWFQHCQYYSGFVHFNYLIYHKIFIINTYYEQTLISCYYMVIFFQVTSNNSVIIVC